MGAVVLADHLLEFEVVVVEGLRIVIADEGAFGVSHLLGKDVVRVEGEAVGVLPVQDDLQGVIAGEAEGSSIDLNGLIALELGIGAERGVDGTGEPGVGLRMPLEAASVALRTWLLSRVPYWERTAGGVD